MTFADRIAQARHDRGARRAARAELDKLTHELAAYSSPADRREIEMMASRSTEPGAQLVLSVLDRMRSQEAVTGRQAG